MLSHSVVSVARQAHLSMGFFTQEHWSGLPFPSPGDLLDSGMEPKSPALQVDSLLLDPPGKPSNHKAKIYSSACAKTWFSIPSYCSATCLDIGSDLYSYGSLLIRFLLALQRAICLRNVIIYSRQMLLLLPRISQSPLGKIGNNSSIYKPDLILVDQTYAKLFKLALESARCPWSFQSSKKIFFS